MNIFYSLKKIEMLQQKFCHIKRINDWYDNNKFLIQRLLKLYFGWKEFVEYFVCMQKR